jgi:hypothetical protein
VVKRWDGELGSGDAFASRTYAENRSPVSGLTTIRVKHTPQR